ncbi:hypothetical protein TTHERM_00085550 (macronuclear) [Tetrahymena thermophila SB210]|uniref:Uncharacterized protein n=1 Tax=Tetrahymena thermophila (strain SB210) TaxID=312017 RepID=Q236P3_TETTS|nr:hypothetical protein TTHERM_00085550 [Tetrahymena thermophila SB210]EAR92457.1 hypothetical protein TTHERM_00085550 [Tetrahymena thermophila SB210]|eukprot:XP_001012702.1 hypothetical protein TTHERM_00085550 [Tetrahymena thermophila SB210]
MEEDFENVYSEEDVKQITQSLNKDLQDQKQIIQKLQMDNTELKKEIDQLKEQLKQKQQIIYDNSKNLVKFELERSKAIEENHIMKKLLEEKDLVRVLDLFSWKSFEDGQAKILEQAKQIEILSSKLRNSDQIDKSNSQGILQYKIFNQENEKEILESQINQLNNEIKQKNQQQLERDYFYEVISNHLGTFDNKDDQQYKQKAKEYIHYCFDALKDIINQLKINVKLSFSESVSV